MKITRQGGGAPPILEGLARVMRPIVWGGKGDEAPLIPKGVLLIRRFDLFSSVKKGEEEGVPHS